MEERPERTRWRGGKEEQLGMERGQKDGKQLERWKSERGARKSTWNAGKRSRKDGKAAGGGREEQAEGGSGKASGKLEREQPGGRKSKAGGYGSAPGRGKSRRGWRGGGQREDGRGGERRFGRGALTGLGLLAVALLAEADGGAVEQGVQRLLLALAGQAAESSGAALGVDAAGLPGGQGAGEAAAAARLLPPARRSPGRQRGSRALPAARPQRAASSSSSAGLGSAQPALVSPLLSRSSECAFIKQPPPFLREFSIHKLIFSVALIFPFARALPNQPPSSALRPRGVELCLLMNPRQQPSPYGHPLRPRPAPPRSPRPGPAARPRFLPPRTCAPPRSPRPEPRSPLPAFPHFLCGGVGPAELPSSSLKIMGTL